MVKITGYILLGISGLLFGLILVIPWFDFSNRQIAGITAGLIIAGEILFYLSIFILGKSFLNKIKSWFKFRKTKAKTADLSGQSE